MQSTAQLSKVWTFDDLQDYLGSLAGDVHWRSYEIVDGALVVSPSPTQGHGAVEFRIGYLLGAACPRDAVVVGAVSIDLAPSYRVPDVVVMHRPAFDSHSALVRPADVLLAVEIVSPSSVTTDRITKPAQYAAAGIPLYWRVETDPEPSLTAYRLPDGAAVYSEVGTWSAGEVAHLTEPFPVTIRVSELLPPASP